MFKKMMLMAGMALAVVAVAAPVASANWTHNKSNIPLGTNPVVTFTGKASFEAEFGGVECEVTAKTQFTGGTTTGHVTEFQPSGAPTTVCDTSGGLAPCDVEATTTTGLPWVAHSDGNHKVTITTKQMDLDLVDTSFFCIIDEVKLEPGSVTATVASGETDAVKKVTLSGELNSSAGQVEVSGQLTLNPEGTYGL